MNIQQYFPKHLKGTFNLRKPKGESETIVYFVVYFRKKQYKISTGVKVHPRHWNKKKQEALISATLTDLENRNNSIVNNVVAHIRLCFALEVEALLNECNRNIRKINIKDVIDIMNSIKSKISGNSSREDDIFEILRKSIENDPIKDSTKRPYQDAVNRFHEYVSSEKIEINSFNDITLDVMKGYQKYLRNKKAGKRSVDGKLSVNHINNLIKTFLQRLDNYAVKEDLMERAIFEKAKGIKPIKSEIRSGENGIALRDDEVFRLFQYHCKTQKEEDIKNLFCLNCCIGQRFSDLGKLNSSIMRSDGRITIHLKQTKCGANIDAPLLFQMAEDIINLYPDGLPTTTNNAMNKHIKDIAKQAGVGLEMVSVPWQSGNDSKARTKEVPRYSLIKTHTCRRTFITMLSLRGYTSRYIADYSGHSDVEMVEHYAKTTAAERMIFEETKRDHPEMILPMIDYTKKKENRPGRIAEAAKGVLLAIGTLFACLFS